MWRANRSVRQEPYQRWRTASRLRRGLVASIAKLPTEAQQFRNHTVLGRWRGALLHSYSPVGATCDTVGNKSATAASYLMLDAERAHGFMRKPRAEPHERVGNQRQFAVADQ
jgi:hypothetical protein